MLIFLKRCNSGMNILLGNPVSSTALYWYYKSFSALLSYDCFFTLFHACFGKAILENVQADILYYATCVFQDEISEPVSVRNSDASEKSSSLAVDHVDPFKRYQDIRHQDFGEIVFRKQKRNKKKSNKGMFLVQESYRHVSQ